MIAISRRALMAGAMLAGSALAHRPASADERDEKLRRGLADLEHKHGGRLGAAILDTATKTLIAHRGGERFPLCSTHKCLSAAFVLARVDRHQESLSRRIVYQRDVLVANSPISEKHIGEDGMTVGDLCKAAMTVSDNTAANLLLDSFGGPKALTAYMRSLGDGITRLDRREPALNEAARSDPRDTTTPMAMAEFLRKTVLGTALSPASRKHLVAWLVANKTGDARLRTGVPKAWRVGDKTGTGDNNATNDIAVIWPPRRAALIVTAYYVESRAPDDERNAVLAEIGRLAAES